MAGTLPVNGLETISQRFTDQGFLEEPKQHLRIQPLIVKRCSKFCVCVLARNMFSFFGKSVDLVSLAMFLLHLNPFTLVEVVPLLLILWLFMIEVCTFFSCPLSSFKTSLVFPFKCRYGAGDRIRGNSVRCITQLSVLFNSAPV